MIGDVIVDTQRAVLLNSRSVLCRGIRGLTNYHVFADNYELHATASWQLKLDVSCDFPFAA